MTIGEQIRTPRPATAPLEQAPPEHAPPPHRWGRLGRLGLWAGGNLRMVVIGWVVLVAVLGAFAPKVTSELAGAGWQANGSESVAVRDLAQRHFGGNASSGLEIVITADRPVTDPAVRQVIDRARALLTADPRISDVIGPQPGATISRDGHTAVMLAGANAGTNDMVRAADDLKGPLAALSGGGVHVSATGASVLWSDFNAANQAMMKSEMLSWPVTMAILVLAFGSVVAAGLPLLLTMAGLGASAGALVLLNHVIPTSIWAMNFAMMFALALGIDYALFLVVRFRSALARQNDARRVVAETTDTAGKAVALSGVTVLVSLSAVMLVPAPAFRSMALGIMLAVPFVLAATLTLLPAVLAKLGHKVNKGSIKPKKRPAGSSRFTTWGERLWAHPLRYGIPAAIVLVALALPVVGLRTAMPSITVVPPDSPARTGYTAVQHAFGPGTLQIITPAASIPAATAVLHANPGIAAVMPAQPAADSSGAVLIQAVPTSDPSNPALKATVTALREQLPADAKVGGAAVENLDLQSALDAKTPLVLAVILLLGFALLVFALQAPLLALVGTATNLLATGAARLIFQDGHGAGWLGFAPQGFLDGWTPVFFFAMIFAIVMDYTVFLLSSAKEHYEKSGSPARP